MWVCEELGEMRAQRMQSGSLVQIFGTDVNAGVCVCVCVCVLIKYSWWIKSLYTHTHTFNSGRWHAQAWLLCAVFVFMQIVITPGALFLPNLSLFKGALRNFGEEILVFHINLITNLFVFITGEKWINKLILKERYVGLNKKFKLRFLIRKVIQTQEYLFVSIAEQTTCSRSKMGCRTVFGGTNCHI